MISPTPRQLDLLRFVRGFQLAHGYSPSFREIGAAIGCRSTHQTSDALDELEDLGAVRRLPNRRRAIELLCNVPIPRAPDGAPLFAVKGEW